MNLIPPEFRDTSKVLFGDRYMLEVCVHIAQIEDRVCLTDLAQQTDVSPSVYDRPLKRLRALGLLVDARRDGDDRRARWYMRRESNLWHTAREFAP